MQIVEEVAGEGTNPPGATRMMIYAFLIFNLSLGCMFGPFGVLVAAIEQKLDVTREISTLPVPIVTFGMALLAPFVGALATRVSLRLLLLAGSLSVAAGFALLAVTNSVVLFIGAYALLIGPALSVCGAVGPTVLVTRWFRVNAGRALGIASTPALMGLTPMLAALVLAQFGLAVVYWTFAAILLVCAVIAWLVVDYPESDAPQAHSAAGGGASELAVRSLLASSRFWRVALAAGLYNAVIIMFATSLVPFATGIGIDPTRAALMLTVYLVGTLVGTPLVGWGADKVGGVLMIAILSASLALWQGLLILHPGFGLLVVLAFATGLQGSAMISAMGLALSQEFGRQSFAKAYGIASVVSLPFAVLSVPVASGIFVRTGSYDQAFLLAAAVLLAGMVLVLSMARRGPAVPAVAN